MSEIIGYYFGQCFFGQLSKQVRAYYLTERTLICLFCMFVLHIPSFLQEINIFCKNFSVYILSFTFALRFKEEN